MARLRTRLPLLLVAFLAFFVHTTFASVLAIDYGSDWIKASLMKPGVPFDVLLNKDSKRKIQSSVAWKDTDRLFGGDAANIATRFPTDSFSSLKLLQAAPFSSDAVSFYTSISAADLTSTSRQTVAIRRKDGTQYTVEELIGMQLSYVKDVAESLAGEKVYDVVLTVPPFYTQFERDAVADAVEIAGLRLLALVNDGTAVGINYAMTRTFKEPETHIVYDAGASSIRATVIQFATDSHGTTTITTKGMGYDRSTGGTELDRRMRDMLAADFQVKHGKDIRTNKRGMARLWKEAGRIKAILSANAEARASVESIAFDIDYKGKFTRKAFEAACADLQPRFAQPILDAMVNANLTIADVQSVIMFGGSTRTPMIQAAVKQVVGDKVAVNVNADEAAVLGAALHGASLSRQFRTKDFKIVDIAPFDVQVSYPAESAQPRTINTLVFPAGSKVNTKKTLTFKRKDDFALDIAYKTSPAPGFPAELLRVEIAGVAEALANLTERGAIDPVIKATVSLSESGFVSVPEVIAFGEIKDESITGEQTSTASAGSISISVEAETDTPASAGSGESETASSASSSASAASSTSSAEKAKKTAAKPEDTIKLTVTSTFPTILPMTLEEKKAARDRLRTIDLLEAGKRRREDARNTLEGYLYRVRDLLSDESAETPFIKCSQPAERQMMREKMEETLMWLNTDGDEADTAQFTDRRVALEILEKPVVHRYTEIEEFPKALNASQMWNWSTRLFITDARNNLTEEAAAGPDAAPGRFTKEDIDALEKTLKEHESWLNEWVEKQKSVKMNEDPVILTTEMKARAKALESHLQRLVKRKAPKRKVASSTASSTPSASEPAVSSSATPLEEGTSPAQPDAPESPAPPTSPSPTPSPHDEL